MGFACFKDEIPVLSVICASSFLQRCCVASPLTFHLGIRVNRLDRPHWIYESRFSLPIKWVNAAASLHVEIQSLAYFNSTLVWFLSKMNQKTTCRQSFPHQTSISLVSMSVCVEYVRMFLVLCTSLSFPLPLSCAFNGGK